MRSHGIAEELERWRRRGVRSLLKGHGVREVARMVGASLGAMVAWRDLYQKKGEGGTAAKPHPGGTPKLSPGQLKKLLGLLKKGSRAYGYQTDLWTLRLYVDIANHNIVTDAFEILVVALLRRLRRPIILVTDRWQVHRAAARRLRRRLPKQVKIEWLPA